LFLHAVYSFCNAVELINYRWLWYSLRSHIFYSWGCSICWNKG